MKARYHRSETHDNATNFRRRMARYKRQVQGDTPRKGEKLVLEIPILQSVRRVK